MNTPKLKIILYRISMGVGIIWLLSAGIWEYQIDNHFVAIFLALGAFGLTWQTIKRWHRPSWGQVAYLVFLIVFISFFNLRKDYINHRNKLILDKFGPSLNTQRAKLGIPAIPADWQTFYYSESDGEWRKKDMKPGHQRKHIFLDTLFQPAFEEDSYNLKRGDSADRYVMIRTYYTKGAFDSTAYTYDGGKNIQSISRFQADSIFKAEKIKKDY